mgnify:CR=1 FL=1
MSFKSKNNRGLVFVCLIIFLALIPVQITYAQSDVATHRAQLERELVALEAEIDVQQGLLQGQQRERVSYERDVAILEAQIEKAKLSIRARDIAIAKINQDINGKEKVIGGLNEKLGREKQSLAQLLRKTNEIDNISLVEIVLGNQNISDFFAIREEVDFSPRRMDHLERKVGLTRRRR